LAQDKAVIELRH